MRQLILDLDAQNPPSLTTFVHGRNAEVAALLDALALAQCHNGNLGLDQRFIYLWGSPGAGKSHLLRALAARTGAHYIAADLKMPDSMTESLFAFEPATRLYLVDDCELLTPIAQVAGFALFNQVREHGAALVTTGSLPPLLLPLREDLRTRLGWGLVYHLHELSDAEKIEALARAAEDRALVLSPGVLPYLITHFQRDMRSLSTMLDALDRYSLETQRPITLPLLRSLLQREGEPPA